MGDVQIVSAEEEAQIRALERLRSQRIAEIRKDEKHRISAENLTAAEMKARQADEEARQHEQEELERRSNRDFVQVYSKGWERIRQLIGKNSSAAMLYAYLAEHIDNTSGSVVASQDFLAEELGKGRTTIWRATKYLEEVGALVRIKVSGQVYAYCLDPDEVWKAWNRGKKTAAFTTKTLVRKSDQDGNVKRKLAVLFKEKRGEPELPFEEINDE